MGILASLEELVPLGLLVLGTVASSRHDPTVLAAGAGLAGQRPYMLF
jgi:hypothetical protein